jgi:predicted phage baseplate assembly protein
MTILDPSLTGLNDCGCCAGVASSVPGVVSNRPGLSAIAYRVGDWHDFKRCLLAALAGSAHPQLSSLTTRADDDFVIALLDATAAAFDVLTFYQERVANESYLRTAAERRSVVELSRLIGYQPKPGVAAFTALAFTVEEAPGAPRVAVVEPGLKVQSVPGHLETAQTFEAIDGLDARAEWNAIRPRLTAVQTFGIGQMDLWLDGTVTDLKAGDRLLLVGREREDDIGGERWDLRHVRSVAADFETKRTHVVMGPPLGSTDPFSAPSPNPRVYALRTRAGVYGHNAPDWRAMSLEFKANYLNVKPADVTAEQMKEWPSFTMFSGASRSKSQRAIDLDAVYTGVLPNSWLVLALPSYVELYRVTASTPAGRAGFGLASKTTRVMLEGENFSPFAGEVRETSVYAQSEELVRAEAPITPGVTGIVTALTVDRRVGAMPKGRLLLLTGVDAATGAAAAEQVVLDRVESAGVVSRLVLTTALTRSYHLDSLTICGNVVRATHGEMVSEVLGAGDAGKRYQQFTLKRRPITFVRDSASASGAVSTLAIRVNDLLWHEKPSFFGLGPLDRVFVTGRDDEGNTTVRFGDGIRGARLPTGRENVRAAYRAGLGTGGNVRAGQLSTLLSRPLGLKEAVNPQPASGGDDPESLDSARANAPLTVLTLDRVVSLRDYEDLARAYAGIAKALATWSWDGERRGIVVTVAGPHGAAVADEVLELLLGAIRTSGDPYVPLRIATYRSARFTTAFKVKTHPDVVKAAVHDAVVTQLRSAFGFASRSFGQSVALSDVMAAIQGVPGIVAVDVDALTRTDGVGGSGLNRPLPAGLPQATSLTGTQAAELLTIADDPIAPGEMA